jgi:hemoglobin
VPDSAETPTLYEWAGGREAIARLIEAFYDRVERDELISPLFPGGVSREHRDHVILWWSEVFGGPSDYTDQLGRLPRGWSASIATWGSPRSSGCASPP